MTSTTTNDILQSLYALIKEYPINAGIPFIMRYPKDGESMGIEKMAGEQVGNCDMLGNTPRTMMFEITYKTQKNGIPTLNGFAEYAAEHLKSLESNNESYEIGDVPTVTLPVQQGADANWGYFSFDINVNIITHY